MIRVAIATPADVGDWARMRHALWPETSPAGHLADIDAWLAAPGDAINFVARSADGQPEGFAETCLRHDYVNGTKSSPVAFLEGIYVEPSFRRTGVARRLVEAVENWARQQGCSELASDTAVTNIASQDLHNALGFVETQRVVFFRKLLS